MWSMKMGKGIKDSFQLNEGVYNKIGVCDDITERKMSKEEMEPPDEPAQSNPQVEEEVEPPDVPAQSNPQVEEEVDLPEMLAKKT